MASRRRHRRRQRPLPYLLLAALPNVRRRRRTPALANLFSRCNQPLLTRGRPRRQLIRVLRRLVPTNPSRRTPLSLCQRRRVLLTPRHQPTRLRVIRIKRLSNRNRWATEVLSLRRTPVLRRSRLILGTRSSLATDARSRLRSLLPSLVNRVPASRVRLLLVVVRVAFLARRRRVAAWCPLGLEVAFPSSPAWVSV
jgi:hypothetical protein